MSRYAKYFVQAKKLNKEPHFVPFQPKFLQVSKQLSKPFPLIEQNQPKRIDLSKYLNIKKGDLVKVLYGRDQGKVGVILNINPKRNTVIVDGCNMKESFWNPRVEKGEASIVTIEMPIHITNVALLDPVVKKPTRVKCRYMMSGECVRISKISGCAMPESTPEKALIWENRGKNQTFLSNKSLKGPIKDIYQEKDRENFKLLKRIVKNIKYSAIAHK